MKQYTYNNNIITYTISEDGYDIFLNEGPWITQHEPFIPYHNLSYEENAERQIEEYIAAAEESEKNAKTTEQRIADIEDALCDLSMLLPAEEEEQA